jgi:hypothetical protein
MEMVSDGNLRFSNDWGSETALWMSGGGVTFDQLPWLPAALIFKLSAQAGVFHEHYSPDTGMWSSEDIRVSHLNDCMEIARNLAAALPSGMSLEHDLWEHRVKRYTLNAGR